MKNLLLISCAFLVACVHQTNIRKDNLSKDFPFYNINNRIILSGTPDGESLNELKKRGVTRVIDLRSPQEATGFHVTVKEAELTYHNVPFFNENGINAESIAKIEKLVAENPNTQLLVHCASGNRAASWLAIHMNQEHGRSKDESLELAKQAGLTSPKLTEITKTYMDKLN